MGLKIVTTKHAEGVVKVYRTPKGVVEFSEGSEDEEAHEKRRRAGETPEDQELAKEDYLHKVEKLKNKHWHGDVLSGAEDGSGSEGCEASSNGGLSDAHSQDLDGLDVSSDEGGTSASVPRLHQPASPLFLTDGKHQGRG